MTRPTSVSMAGMTWETGREIIDCEVTLGSAEKSSTLKVILADPGHKIAAALINHSVSNKGIQEIEGTEKRASTNKASSVSAPKGVVGKATAGSMASSGEQFTPQVKAFLDAVAMRETATAKTDIAKSYTSLNGTGYLTEAQIAKAGFPPSSITPGGRNIGRYQLNSIDWGEAVKAGFAKNDFSRTSQDGIALFKLFKRNRGGKELQAGDVKGAFRKAANEWVSIPGGSQYQPQAGTGTAEEILNEYYSYYQQRLAFYGGKGDAPKDPLAATATKAPKEKTVPPSPATSSTGVPVIKGSTISANIDGFLFDFVHQGTDMSSDGTTTVTGQGVRWVMSRAKRNRTLKDLTLKDLAMKVAKDHKVKLEYLATYNPTYSHIDQTGISDYKLLLREAVESGLLVGEKDGTMLIIDRKTLFGNKVVLSRGVNLISYQISDTAVGANSQDISKLLPGDAKTALDPIAGKVKPVGKDASRTKTTAVSGAAKSKTKGTLKSGETKQIQEKAKTKRIFALPSTFVLPLSKETLELVPLSTCVTEGFPSPLDRRWYVQSVTHSVGSDTTTLQVASPMEVLDRGDAETGEAPAALAKSKGNLGKGWVYPVSGTVSDTQITPKRKHGGVDIAAGSGTPIYAAESGVVAANQFQSGGGGNMIVIKHENGYFTEYFHMVSPSPLRVGTKVAKGDQIGGVGTTGGSTGNHLHFGLTSGLFSGRLQVSNTFPDMSRKGATITALKSV